MDTHRYSRLSRAVKAGLGLLLAAQSVIVLGYTDHSQDGSSRSLNEALREGGGSSQHQSRGGHGRGKHHHHNNNRPGRSTISFQGAGTAFVPTGATFDPFLGVTAADRWGRDVPFLVQGGVDTSKPGIYKVVYEAASGRNTNDRDRIVFVLTPNDLPPELFAPREITVYLNDTFNPLDARYRITAYDPQDGDITADITTSGDVDTTKAGFYTQTYTVEDSEGNEATATSQVHVRDRNDRQITIRGIRDTSIPLGTAFNPLAGVTAFDRKEGSLTSKITVSGSVDVEMGGTYPLIYTVSNSAGVTRTEERRITVRNADPKIQGADSREIPQNSTFDPLAGVIVTDREEGDLLTSLEVTGTVDSATVGVYTLTYTAKDTHGGEDVVIRNIVVLDPSGVTPVLPTIAGATATSIPSGAEFDPRNGVTATDSAGDDLTSAITITGRVDTTEPGRNFLLYMVEDPANYSNFVIRKVTVENQGPVISGLTPLVVSVGSTPDLLAGVTATDPEEGDITSRIRIRGRFSTARPGTYNLRYTVSDRQGKTAVGFRTVTVEAITTPAS